jgi:glutamyl/glutaminyl-tRNA synthetase
MHIGHVVNAIYVWGLARAVAGRVILRIEDHDRQRSRHDFERALLDDLDWLGFAADIYPADCYRRGACDGRQSERDATYRAALAPLIDAGLVYGCRCSRTALATWSASSADGDNTERRYPGTCRDEQIPLDEGVSWRLRMAPGVETFDDVLLGPQAQDPSTQCGDLLLRDRLGNWTYQCAVTIDDAAQNVTLVVRGEDLLPSTGRQIRLARLIGRATPPPPPPPPPTPPRFVHHPLIMKSPTQKLSKSDGDTGIRDLRAAGWTSADVIGHAASLAGLTPKSTPLRPADLASLFT